jgi:hypothetical protein
VREERRKGTGDGVRNKSCRSRIYKVDSCKKRRKPNHVKKIVRTQDIALIERWKKPENGEHGERHAFYKFEVTEPSECILNKRLIYRKKYNLGLIDP